MTSRPPTPVERVFAAMFLMPLGLGAKLVDELPANLTKARQQIDTARFLGKMVVERGMSELGAKVSDAPVHGNHRSSTTVVETTAIEVRDDADEPRRSVDVAGLALADYDQLPAAHIIAKLDGLTDGEVDDIEAFEQEHRGRRTILGKIDRIRAERS